MVNISGRQPDVKFWPACKGELRNVPRDEMDYAGYVRADGTVSRDTHTYECERLSCKKRFEINQDR